MAYDMDLTRLLQALSTRFGEEIGCMVQSEIEALVNTQGVDIEEINRKLGLLETALNGAADGEADGDITIAQNVLSMIGELASLNTNSKSSLVDAINELKAQLDSGAYNGQDGADGKSAYEIAVDNGFNGTEAEWLESLRGPAGPRGERGEAGIQGPQGIQGVKGNDGADGKSAYEIAVDHGFTGTEEEWLASLKGEDGDSIDPAILDGKVDKSEVTNLLGNVESLVALFKTGMATGKQARINGTCDQLGNGGSNGGSGEL